MATPLDYSNSSFIADTTGYPMLIQAIDNTDYTDGLMQAIDNTGPC